MGGNEQIETAIAALEEQRGVLGDAVVETALAPLRATLAAARAKSGAIQQPKQITVLFADVAGSTRMGQALDPEDMLALMDGALARGAASKRMAKECCAAWATAVGRIRCRCRAPISSMSRSPTALMFPQP